MRLLLTFLLFTGVSYAQIPMYIPTDGLIGWYGFNGNANDETGNGNNPISNINSSIITEKYNHI